MGGLSDIGKLLLLIFREGKLRHSAHDFNRARSEALEELREFMPQPIAPPEQRVWLRHQHPLLKGVIAQGAFIGRSRKQNGGHLFAASPGLAYIRIPKAASTALSLALLKARYPHLPADSISPAQINFLADVNLEPAPDRDNGTALFFTAVRDPFARIVSVYRQFFEHPDGDFLYEDYLFGILRKGMSFKQFLRTILLIPDTLKDQHFKPQHLFLAPYQHRRVPVRVLRLEETGTLTDFLAPFEITLERINDSRSPYDYREYFDEEAADLALRIYAEDCHRFRYPPLKFQRSTGI